MYNTRRYSGEVRERAVRLVFENERGHSSQWAAICSIAERQRLRDLERENRELKRANESPRNASAYFAQAELGRRAR